VDDLARLQIRVQSLEAEVADQRLKGLERTGRRTERATDGLTAAFKRFAGPVAAAAGAVATLRKVVSVTREFEVLNAQLVTATGSAESAGVAFEAIQDFASSTPYDLQQVTEGFVKLVNLGLTPSEAALTSYGNTASAMGKDLNQLIEAVADAATGEFERLKEFGIRAKSQGDEVSFTFRGVTTTVGKNAAEIEAYLQALGENEFAGAMQQRVETLDGALSNLGDEWDKLFLNISNTGIGEVIEDSVRVAIDILAELNAMLASGQIEGYLDAIAGKFEGFGRDVATTIDILTELWNDFLGTPEGEGLAGATGETLKFIIAAFKNLPENIRAVIQLMAVEIGALVDYGKAYGQAFGEVLGSEFAKIVEKSKAYGQAIGQAINPFDDNDFDLEARLRELDAIAADMADNAFSRAEKQAAITTQARRDSIVAILEERDAALASFDTQITAAETLRKKYDEELAARKAAGEDRLAQFRTGADPTEGGETDAERKAREAREKEFENLRQSLRSEEEVIQESYDKRLAIILNNTEEGSKQQADLKQRLDEEFATQALGDLAAPDTFEEQLNQLEEFYNARRELILNNTAITEEQRTQLEEELTKQRNERLAALEQQRMSVIFSSSAQLFDGLAGLAKQFAGEQSTTFKLLFAASKAFAIAEAVVKIQQGIANAASLPFPANLPAMASVISATAGIVSTISGTNYNAGAFDSGGTIPQGKIGLVGEFGPELVEGPANVRSRRETAAMFKEASNDDGGSGAVAPNMQNNIRIVNNVDPAVFEDFLGSTAGEELIMNTIRNNPETVRAVSGS
jgi:hypothetical protein